MLRAWENGWNSLADTTNSILEKHMELLKIVTTEEKELEEDRGVNF